VILKQFVSTADNRSNCGARAFKVFDNARVSRTRGKQPEGCCRLLLLLESFRAFKAVRHCASSVRLLEPFVGLDVWYIKWSSRPWIAMGAVRGRGYHPWETGCSSWVRCKSSMDLRIHHIFKVQAPVPMAFLPRHVGCHTHATLENITRLQSGRLIAARDIRYPYQPTLDQAFCSLTTCLDSE
jgi:hypothetical protein